MGAYVIGRFGASTVLCALGVLTLVSCDIHIHSNAADNLATPQPEPEEAEPLVIETEAQENWTELARELALVDQPGIAVPEAVLKDYHDLLGLIRASYPRTTDAMIRDAADTVYAARQYWTDVDMLWSLKSLARYPESNAARTAAQRTELGLELSDIEQAAADIYATLEFEFYRPYLEKQQSIQQNLDAMRERGQAYNVFREEANRRAMLPDPVSAQKYLERLRQDEIIREEWRRRNLR